MLKSAKLWMITDSSLLKPVPSNQAMSQMLAEKCSRHWSELAAIVLREKRWELETVQLFWEALACNVSYASGEAQRQPLRLLNWPMTYEPWTLPIDGIHLDAVAANTLLKYPDIYEPFIKRIEEKKWLIGLSIHSYSEWALWRDLKPDYIFLSNIYETDCKVGKIGLGIDATAALLTKIRQDCPKVSIIGLGGLKRSDLPEMREIGLNGIALRSELHRD